MRPMHAVYWHAIEWAIANGKTVIDWVTAPVESSLGNFKRQWGAEPIESFRYTYLPGGKAGQPPTAEAAQQQAPAPGEAGAWDRIPVDVLGAGVMVAHRLLWSIRRHVRRPLWDRRRDDRQRGHLGAGAARSRRAAIVRNTDESRRGSRRPGYP